MVSWNFVPDLATVGTLIVRAEPRLAYLSATVNYTRITILIPLVSRRKSDT